MTLFVLCYLAGALTILTPCVLPVLPLLAGRLDQPFSRAVLPQLAGLALAFAAVATLAGIRASWSARLNETGRAMALAVFALMGLCLLAPRLANRLSEPLVAIGARLSERAHRATSEAVRSVGSSLLLGVATGLLWTPCAGPVLGLVLATTFVQGTTAQTSLLLLTYAAGAASSLGVALWSGGRLYRAIRHLAGAADWLRRTLGVAVLAGVAGMALGLDRVWLEGFASSGSWALEESLLQRWLAPAPVNGAPAAAAPSLRPMAALDQPALPPLPVEGRLPELAGATAWLQSQPLTAQSLRGKVVLIDFWTFGCINCRNALPYVRAWDRKYRDQGLVVIGVHSPEFAFERNVASVERAVRELGLAFPIAVDNDHAIWRAFSNRYWPAHYFVDAQGRVRFHHFGEGEYERSEQVIRQLLEEARAAPRGPGKGT